MGLDAVAWVNFPSTGHASETAEPQQDSGPTGCHWVSRAGAVWAPSNPLKAKVDGWGWTHASETAEPQQDSGPTGCHWVSRAPAGTHAKRQNDPTGCHWVSRAGAVWAPSNPLKANVDGWGWTLWPWVLFQRCEPAKSKGGWVGLDAVRTRKKQRWVGGAGRCRFLGAVASESKGGWAGLDAVALGAVASVAALHLRRLLPAGHHAG